MLEIVDLRIASEDQGAELARVDRLTFRRGEAHVLLGRTGAGKSLIAKALAGVPSPGLSVSGQFRTFDGHCEPLGTARAHWSREVFLLPQEPSAALDPTATVGRQIGEVLRWRRARNRPVADLETTVSWVGLSSDDLKKMPHACSGGMLQRVLISMALVVDANLIICDEPTKGLDLDKLHEMAALLDRLKREGLALLVITHDLALARAIGDALTVVEAGRVVEQGAAPELLARPTSSALRNLLVSEPDRWRPRSAINRAKSVPLVKLDSVGHRLERGSEFLFRGIGLTVRQGEIVGLSGASGTGKTTLGNIMLGLTMPTEGTVFWQGKPLKGLSRREYRQMRPDFGKLFQDPSATFPPWLTAGAVLNKLTLYRSGRYGSSLDLHRLLDRLDLGPDVLDRRPHALSGGELQRLAIARAVLVEPAFLVCDEPSSRLDMVVQKEAIELLVSSSAFYCPIIVKIKPVIWRFFDEKF